MEKSVKSQTIIITSIALSIAGVVGFLFETKLIYIPLLLILASIYLIFPYRKESGFVRRLVLIYSLFFAGWLLSDLRGAIMPFLVSFLIAYLFDPFISWLSRKKFPRWLASLLIIIIFVGIVSSVAVFVFPTVFSQLDDAIKKISSLVNDASDYLESRKFYRKLSGLGLPSDTLKTMIKKELIPKIEGIFTLILEALLTLLNSVSVIATQILNAILIPILSFYFLKDFARLKRLIKSILEVKDKKLLYDLHRIDVILRKYITWQIIAASIVASTCSITFSIFGVPYPIVLGVLCGVFNPIPYLGIFASLILCFITVIIVNPENLWQSILVIVIVIDALHFVNAYILEPNIAGKQVGLHPVMLIASLFVFGGMFGFIGLLVAVPTTAVIMMFFNDWRQRITKDKAVQEELPMQESPV